MRNYTNKYEMTDFWMNKPDKKSHISFATFVRNLEVPDKQIAAVSIKELNEIQTCFL